MSEDVSLLWLRSDLRLDDQPALHAAMADGRAVVPVFIWDPASEGDWPLGGAARVWLDGSLKKLDAQLRAAGSRLIVRQGNTVEVIEEMADKAKACALYWSRRYEPSAIICQEAVEKALVKKGLAVGSFNASLLFEPWSIETKSHTPYKVFTPFYRACLAASEPERPIAAPKKIRAPARWPPSLKIDQLKLLPTVSWDTGIRHDWQPGEPAAAGRVDQFLKTILQDYPDGRDRPDVDGTSRLSPRLHFGEISPRRLWHTVLEATRENETKAFRQAAESFLRQLIWREFAYHLLYHFPQTPAEPLYQKFAEFPWRKDPRGLRAWQRGQTGYPIVDAGMRQLWTTGWMHNRVRMIVGSFLVKDLLLPWQNGARWFWDTLVDADLANNTLGWQWVAGCGADAAPFFRIFNPTTPGQKFDPQGAYVRRWVPELARLPDRWIHQPAAAPTEVLREAGIKLGRDYPRPIVAHDEARQRALAALKKSRGR